MSKKVQKYSPDNTMEYILRKISEYQEHWKQHLLYWQDDKKTIHTDIDDFLNFTKRKIEQKDYELLPRIFEVIENLIVCGDETVNNAASLSFLESLVNSSGHRPDELPYESYIPLLGLESRKVCRELDEFWGAKTPGLWGPNEKFTPQKWQE